MDGQRRQARERALSLLYEAEARSTTIDAILDEQVLPPDPFAVEIVRGVATERSALDEVISSKLRSDWSLDRLAQIDHLVLLIGLWELRSAGTPKGVALSEAVELAKRYGTEDSGRFINGLLAAAGG